MERYLVELWALREQVLMVGNPMGLFSSQFLGIRTGPNFWLGRHTPAHFQRKTVLPSKVMRNETATTAAAISDGTVVVYLMPWQVFVEKQMSNYSVVHPVVAQLRVEPGTFWPDSTALQSNNRCLVWCFRCIQLLNSSQCFWHNNSPNINTSISEDIEHFLDRTNSTPRENNND